MDIQLRLKQFLKLDEAGSPSLSRIAHDANLSRHALAHLLNESAASINRKNLAKICRYLVDRQLAEESELPGVLFTSFPEELWSMLVERSRVEFCMGARSGPDAHDQYISGADVALQAELLFRITGEQPDKQRREVRGKIDPHVVATWDRKLTNANRVKKAARDSYRGYQRVPGDRALICLGSVKSNPVIELVVQGMFKRTRPFVSQDGVAAASQRGCPFFMLYRSTDPQPASCCGGRRLFGGKKKRPGKPGIHFEQEDGSWKHVPYHETSDGALVLYHFQPSSGRLEMVLGGFSGRGTRCLAAFLGSGRASELWPGLRTPHGHVGAYVIHFKLGRESSKEPAAGPPPTSEVVYRINDESLKARLH